MGHYASNPTVLTVTMVGMLLGAISFSNYQRLTRRSQGDGHHRDPQVYALVGVVLVGASVLFVLEDRPWHAMFDTVSAVTTTGFSLDDPANWSPTRKLFTTAWMIIVGYYERGPPDLDQARAESRNVGRPTRSPARASAAVSRHLEATQEVTMRVILR